MKPPAGWVLVDVQGLPESPKSIHDVPMDAVRKDVERVTIAVREGKDVLVRCKHGVSRSPTIAKLALQRLRSPFRDPMYYPNKVWRSIGR